MSINRYAALEGSLCDLFAHCGDMSAETASTIFYKIASSRSRIEILGKLKKKKHGNVFNLF